MTPNWFAVCTLCLWPFVTIGLYVSRPVVQATLWTILAAQMLLPFGTFFKFDLIPQLDKNSIPSVCALFGCMLATSRPLKIWPKFGAVEILISMYLIGPFITSLLNGDAIYVGDKILGGVGPYDGLSAALSQFISLVPFLLGRQFFRNPRDIQSAFSTLVLAGTAYSILLLFEIRMSPQLNSWVYGYYSSDFIQEVRDGGYRPMVFMGHGLTAAFFAMATAVASSILWRQKVFVIGKFLPVLVTTYLSIVLVLCKSGAALVYGAVLIPLVRWVNPRLQMRLAVIIVALALTYPLMRVAKIFPTDSIVNIAMSINAQRGNSLTYRFNQENLLLERASQRFLFGWGRFGRNRVYVVDYRGIAGDASVTDGRWIITLGQFGLFGFLAEFGLLSIPIFFASRALSLAKNIRHGVLLAGLSLIVSVNIVDLLPNSTLVAWTWLLAGALLGCSEATILQTKKQMHGAHQSIVPRIHLRGLRASSGHAPEPK